MSLFPKRKDRLRSATPASEDTDNKTVLEERKLELEIAELQRSWYYKPAFFVPFFGTLSTLLILELNGFFDTKNALLTMQTEKLERKKASLLGDSARLEAAKRGLKADTLKLHEKLDRLNKISESKDNDLRVKTQELLTVKNALLIQQKKLAKANDNLNYATKPKLEITFHGVYNEGDFGIYVKNVGSGTAYFKHINFYYKGQSFIGDMREHFFDRVVDGMGLSMSYIRYEGQAINDNPEKSSSLPPGKEYPTLKIANGYTTCSHCIQEFMKAIPGLRIEIEYQSSMGKSYKLTREFKEEEIY